MAAVEKVWAVLEKRRNHPNYGKPSHYEKMGRDGMRSLATEEEYNKYRERRLRGDGGFDAAETAMKKAHYDGTNPKETSELAGALDSGARIDVRRVGRDVANADAHRKNLRAAMFYGGLEDQARWQFGNSRAANAFSRAHDLSMKSFRDTAPRKNRSARKAMYWYLKER
jgi:hypothetical protein